MNYNYSSLTFEIITIWSLHCCKESCFILIFHDRNTSTEKNVLMINIVSWYIWIFAYKEWNLVYFLHFHFLPYFSINFPSNYSLHLRPHEFVYLHSIIRQKLLHQSIFCESVFYESIFGESVFYDSIFFPPQYLPAIGNPLCYGEICVTALDSFKGCDRCLS